MKRLLCISLALVLVFSILPGTTLAAASGNSHFSGQERRITHSRLTTDISGLQLKEGHYERWIDRLANVPDYAQSFYLFLEESTDAQGVLADFELAERDNDDYYLPVTVHIQTAQLPATASNYPEVAAQAATDGAKDAFYDITNYLGAVYDAFDRDHPEVFWLNGAAMFGYKCGYGYSYSAGVVTVRYEVPIFFYLKADNFDIRYENYRSTEAVAKDIALRDKAVADILAECPTTGASDRIHYLNRVLTERNAYNSAVAMGNAGAAEDAAWECLNALVGSAGVDGPVCEGYSRAFMVLCRQLGIPCVLVDGPAKSMLDDTTEDHMWNYVKLEDRWYAVDVTWNDPYNSRKPMDKLSGYESEKWMLLGSDTEVSDSLTFIQSHLEENQVSSGGLMYVNGPVLSVEKYISKGARVPVTLKNPGDTHIPVTLSLYVPGTETPLAEVNYTGSEVAHTFENLASGSYLLVVSKEGYTTMDYTVATGETPVRVPAIIMHGDIGNDGSLNIADVAMLYAHGRGTAPITDDYLLRVADINGDGLVNICDTAMAYAKVKAQIT